MSRRRPAAALLAVVVGAVHCVPVYTQGLHELNESCKSLGASLRAQGRSLAAVVDFTDLGGQVTPLGRFLAEEVSGCIVEQAQIQLVERLRLSAILQEQKLGESGAIDPATAKKLGEIVGVEAVITGTMTPFGDSIRVYLRALDVATARVVGAASASIPINGAVQELLSRTASPPPSSSAAGASNKAATVPLPPPQQAEDSAGGVSLRVMECRKASGVVCRFMATNSLDTEIRVRIASSTAVDDLSNDVAWSSATFVLGQEAQVIVGARASGFLRLVMPFRDASRQDGLDPRASALSSIDINVLLDLGVGEWNGLLQQPSQKHALRFRNLPVQ